MSEMLTGPKKIVDGLTEVFRGLTRMCEGMAEQIELLEFTSEDAEDEDKLLPPAKLPAVDTAPRVQDGINGDLRQKGKIATLACGYGGSSGALISMGALQMGLKEEELPEIIDSWREANPKIVQYWWDVEKAAMQSFKTGERQDIGRISFAFSSGTLWMVLPSGRKLAYLVPKQQPNRFGRMSLTYEGVGQNHKWARQETYSGRLVENATQAIARDILAEAMARIEDEGLNIVAHIHDEVIIEAPKGKYTVEEICQLMAANPDWCDGLPLAAAGYKGDYYFKD